MPLYDFSCENGHTNEARKDYGTPSIPCPECGETALRVQVNREQCVFGETCAKNQRHAEVPRDEIRHDKDFRLYREASEELDYSASKLEKETGTKVKTPNLFQAGVKRAKKIKAGLAAPLKV